MAVAYKVLGQVATAATTDTTLYTVPSATQVVASTIVVCNRGSVSATYRIALRPNGATLANEHYSAYDVTIAANDTVPLTLGITCDATDVFTVRASTANLTFQIYGCEIT